jgi:hypothetical protein
MNQQWQVYREGTKADGLFILMRLDSTGAPMTYKTPSGETWYTGFQGCAMKTAKTLTDVDDLYSRNVRQEQVCRSQAEVLHLWKRDARSMADQLNAADCKMSAADIRAMADEMQQLQDMLNGIADHARDAIKQLCAEMQDEPWCYHPQLTKLPEQKEQKND